MPAVRGWSTLAGTDPFQIATMQSADAFAWIGASGGAWGDASNWRNVTTGQNPALSVPGPADSATISGPTGSVDESITGGGSAASLALTGYLALNGSFAVGALTLGSPTASGTVVAGSNLSAGTVAAANGALLVSGAGIGFAASGLVSVGVPSGVTTPNNGSFSATAGTTGTLSIAGGASLTAAGGIAIGQGVLTVGGGGSALSVTGDLTVGTQAPSNPIAPYTNFNTGSLSVLNGASLAVSGGVINDQGPILVSGTGSDLRMAGTLTFNASDDLVVDLAVASGATVQARGLLIQQPYQGTVYHGLRAPVIEVDSTSVLEIGSQGGAVPGALTVDPGQSFTASTQASLFAAGIINNGAIAETGGGLSLSGAIQNAGVISDTGGTLTLESPLSGSGAMLIGANASVAIDGSVAAGQTIYFDGAGASLIVNEKTTYNGQVYTFTLPTVAATLSGFAVGDGIVLPSNPLTAAKWTATGGNFGTLALLNGTTTVASFTVAGDYAEDTFSVSAAAAGGGGVTLLAAGGGTSPVSTTTDAFSWIGPSGAAWSAAADWWDVTSGQNPALAVPGANNPVTISGPTGSVYETISGGGTAASLALTGLVALSGRYATGALSVGSVPPTGSDALGGLVLGFGSGLAASRVTVADGSISESGTGTRLSASGTISVGVPSGLTVATGGSFAATAGAAGTLSVAGGATLTAAAGMAIGLGALAASGAGTAISVTGDVVIGTQYPTNPTPPYTNFNTGSVSVTGGATISASGAVVTQQGSIVVSGTGSSLRMGGVLTIDSSEVIPYMAVLSGATVQANGMLIQQPYQGTGYSGFGAPDIAVDGLSVLEIGSAGGAASGALTIDAGRTLATTTAAGIYAATIVNNGAITDTGGALTLGGPVVNNGTIGETGGTLTLQGPLSGTGDVWIAADASVAMDASSSAGGTVTFGGAGASLIVNQTSVYNGQIYTYSLPSIAATLTGFAVGDGIVFPFNPLTKATWTATGSASGTLGLSNGASTIATFTLAGNYAAERFIVSATTLGSTVTLADGGPPVEATVAQALSGYSANPNLNTFDIVDTAAAVQSNLDALQDIVAAIDGIELTGTGVPAFTVTWARVQSDASVLALLPADYTLNVSGVPMAGVSALRAGNHVTSLSIADSAANVAAGLTVLQTLAAAGQLGSIALTDSGIPDLDLSLAQLSGGGAVLAKLSSPYVITATDTVAVTTQGIDLAGAASTSGAVTVIGSQAQVHNMGGFVVGDAGVGALTVLSGAGIVTSPGSVAGAAGLVIAGAEGAGGSSVSVSGLGSRLSVGGLLEVGVADSGGLQISGGATATAGSLDAGVAATAAANIAVSGTGTDLSIAGDATVGDAGAAVLSVLSGAQFSAAGLTIGGVANGSGAVVVAGTGSAIDLSGTLNVGTSLGTGDLTVGAGAVVHASVVNLDGQVVLEGGLLDPEVQWIDQGQTVQGFGTLAAGDIVDEGVIRAGGVRPGQMALVLEGTIFGGGTLIADGAPQPVSRAGELRINDGGTLELAGAVMNTPSTGFSDDLTPAGTYVVNNSVIDVSFADGAGVLKLDDIGGFAGTIAAWLPGDAFVVTGGTLSGLTVSNGDALTFRDSGPNAGVGGIDRIMFGAPVSDSEFEIVGGNTVRVACFAAGTRIATEAGSVAVEDLRIGDRLITLADRTDPAAGAVDTVMRDGRGAPIVWIGRRAVACGHHPEPETVWPVRVRAGAFGGTVPARDLYLSPDHAVYVNGVLVPVHLLVDGMSIASERRDTITYYHVELPRHAVIFAEGLPVESYLDTGDRANFNESAEAFRLWADVSRRHARSSGVLWETRGAAPLVLAGQQLRAARRIVTDRAALKSRAHAHRA